MPPEARRRIAEETLDIYAPLAGRMGMHEMREELEDLAFRELNPDAYRVISERLAALAARSQDRDRRDRAAAHQEARRARHRGRGHGPAEAALFDLAQDGAQVDRLRAALRHLRLPRARRHDRGLLPGARHRAHDLADGAGALQGLHLDAEAERLPLAPHHRDRARQAARRAADPHPRRCTRSPNTASRRMRSTRTATARRPRCCRARATPMRGCAAPSSCWPKARIRRNSSSTPSSSCSTTRCSASRRRAS